ncbi:MAG: hypothetical protein JNK05_11615 [Myxococcales bacterium]|nr:hypothetical protein [Myxococcales bacterium]
MNMTTILDALDQLRMAALRGDVDAAERAKQIADRLEQAAVPAQFLRRARLLALESEGYVLRREIDSQLIAARGAALLRAGSVEGSAVAAGLLLRGETWKREVDRLAEQALDDNDIACAAMVLQMRGSSQLQEVQSYTRTAPEDAAFRANVSRYVEEGVARAQQTRDLFAEAGIDEMRVNAAMMEVEWLWVGGRRADAVARAEQIARDPAAASAPLSLRLARSVVNGGSPMPEFDALPPIDRL